MIIFAAIYNCNIYGFEDFDEGNFLRWQRVDAPYPDAAAQDRFVYWQPHSGGHFDELKWIGPGAYAEALIVPNEEQRSKNAADMEVDEEVQAEEAKAVNASQSLPQEESDFLKQLSRIQELANMAEEDPQSRARIAQEGKRKKKQRRLKTKITTKKALKCARERLHKFPTTANLQALQEGLDEAGALKKSRLLLEGKAEARRPGHRSLDGSVRMNVAPVAKGTVG